MPKTPLGKTLRNIISRRGYHVFFAASLLGMIALAAWWSVFIMAAIRDKHENELAKINYRARIAAVFMGHDMTQPELGELKNEPGLEIFHPKPDNRETFALEPIWPNFYVGISASRLAEIEEKHKRQRIMWIGEGSTLLLLLLVSTFMLYRLVASEQRFRRDMDRFIDLVTHELKTPLAGVRMLLQSIAMNRVDDVAMPRLVGLGLKDLDRLEHLVENILVRNRLRFREYVPRLEPVDPAEIVRAIVDHRMESRIGGKSPEIPQSPAPKALADADSLRIVIENLLDNAEKYGGDKPVRVAFETDADNVRIVVADEGLGIDAQSLPAIFAPYFRAGRAKDGVRHGSGLGLAISRDLAVGMGGDLTAQSDGPGKGSRFIVRLKRAQ